VTLGLTSRNGSPLQLLDVGVGSAAMQNLPWAFVPTVLVPFFLIVHGAIFARMGPQRRQRRPTADFDRRPWSRALRVSAPRSPGAQDDGFIRSSYQWRKVGMQPPYTKDIVARLRVGRHE